MFRAVCLAGFRGIPDELREAARMDGATEWQLYRHVLFPQLAPVALSALVIIGHMSLKSFDLIMSISSPSNDQAKVPAGDMFVCTTSFDDANSAAISSSALGPLNGYVLARWSFRGADTVFARILLGKYFAGGLMSGSVKG